MKGFVLKRLWPFTKLVGFHAKSEQILIFLESVIIYIFRMEIMSSLHKLGTFLENSVHQKLSDRM
jgi:hypothetical protein